MTPTITRAKALAELAKPAAAAAAKLAKTDAAAVAKAARGMADTARRKVPHNRPVPKRRAVVLRSARYPLWSLLGAVLAYFFDPVAGRGRRHRLADRSAAVARRGTRRARAKASYAEGRLRGTAARMTGKGRPHPVDDVEVKHQVQQALSRSGLHRRDVLVDVCNGTATLRGELSDQALIKQAERVATDVPGVVEVVSDLHLPGQPPPHKVVVLRAS